MQFTLDQLLALEAIERTGTFAAAAKELHRVPSAVTYLVRGLEDAVGVEIFDRSRRTARLTRSGRQILAGARAVLDQARNLEQVAMQMAGGWEGELHVVVDGALPMGPLTDCLRRFSNPDVPTALRVDVEYQEGVVDRFNEGPADIGIFIGFAGDGDEDGLVLRPLPPLDLVMVAAPEHPLTRLEVTDATRAAHAELVVRDSSPKYAQRTKPSFMGSRNVAFLSDFHSKRIALLAGAGYGWVPRHLIADDMATGALVLLAAEPSEWTYYPQVVTREGQRLGRAAELFLATIDAALP
ncbi:MAG: DNA-binding transcriptional LysR family regulator [Myxococcota bacterium]|jgi:DNA-binding transcriptional LysR family regulator